MGSRLAVAGIKHHVSQWPLLDDAEGKNVWLKPRNMLIVTRPTSSTEFYTVSTRSRATTLAARLKTVLLISARLLAGIVVITVLLHEYRTLYPSLPSAQGLQSWLESLVLESPSGQIASLIAAHSTRIWRFLICSGVIWLILRKGYTEESLLVVRGLGVQTSTSSQTYLWASSTRFIPTSSIQDIFIHEAFKGFEVRYYLSIVVEGEEDVVVVFPVRSCNRDRDCGAN